MKVAVVTGASSGLGTEFVKAIISGCKEIDEVWMIARRRENLDRIAADLGPRAMPFPLDLSARDSDSKLHNRLSETGAEVSLLINNAGFGLLGDFDSLDNERQCECIDLNCRALTSITGTLLPFMRSGSKVINVCSIAAFAPNPRMAVYCSTKAYVLSFSRALRFEMRKKGINVLAVCPGPMETEFLPAAGIGKGTSHTFDTLPRCDPAAVAAEALRASQKNRGVCTPRGFYKLYRLLAKVLPHSLVMHFSKT